MAFIDEVKLHIKAGDGGDGVVRWRSEKYKPKAGPGGGNGGNGGDVYAEAVADLGYLDYYTHKKNFAADNGIPGQNLGKHGANAEDLVLKFPRGTVLKNIETDEIFDLKEVGDRICILEGGRGGLGNEHFKSSTNTTPYEWTPGKQGGEADFFVELKLFADAGFVGLPSAGKSTLLNSLTNAKSKVGAYHFTTLDPHLGAMGDYILADIPGIIEGASDGKGLGYKFLRHIQRTLMLVHVVSLESEDVIGDYTTIRTELENYNQDLAHKKEIILLSKTDMVDAETLEKITHEMKQSVGHDKVYAMSAYDQESIDDFKKLLWQTLDNLQTQEGEENTDLL